MIRVVPAQYSHIKQLQQLEGLFFTGAQDEENTKMVIERSTAFSVVDGDHVLGAGGVIMQWPGVGTLWLMAGKDLKCRPRLLLNITSEMIEKIRQRGKFHRLQAFVDPSDSRHIRFMEALGFTFEGKLVKHTVDQGDHLIYAKIY